MGAAIAAGLESKIWNDLEDIRPFVKEEITVHPETGTTKAIEEAEKRWKRAVEASYGWAL